MQRRHMMHFEESRSRAGVLTSTSRPCCAPVKRTLRTLRSLATACSSQSPARTQVWHWPLWSESSSSTTVRRASRTFGVLVRTFMPSATGIEQEAASVRAPSTSTRQTRQPPTACTPLR
jgi:hypothetical protein